jgi:hypothetical protein
MRFGTGVVGFAAVGALLASIGCGGPRYQYVQNNSLGVYAKLPAGWTVYDEKSLFPDDSQTERTNRAKGSWTRTFDGGAKPTVAESQAMAGSDDPVGMVRVEALSPSMRDQINITQLRGLAGLSDPTLDPVAVSQQNQQVSVVSDQPKTFKGGFHGEHTVCTLQGQAGGTSVIDTTALLNSTNNVIYMFRVTCSAKCYFETHKDEIAKVVDSWTIQEVR